MNVKHLLVVAALLLVAIATNGLSKVLCNFAKRKAWGERALAVISFYASVILITCLIGGLAAFALSFPADNRPATVQPADPPSTMLG